jgi:YebC/PmpR family DNA-binding regulatory protein
MSGHSKWHSIRHKKAAVDAKRGKLFSRLAKDITIAAQIAGGEPDNNPRLRTAIQAGRAANMPMKNIENAIKKGTGELGGAAIEEIVYEGYGPGGTAFIVETATDNKNRTAAEIRHVFSKQGGNLGESGCVSYLFNRKGQLVVAAPQDKEDDLMEIALDAGAEDVEFNDGEDSFTISTEPSDEILAAVNEAFEKSEFDIESSEIRLVPSTTVTLEKDNAMNAIRMYDAFDDHEDVQAVHTNFDIPEELLAEL